jgi:hypothetical protein
MHDFVWVFKENVVHVNIHVHRANMRKCHDAVLMGLLKHGGGKFMNLVRISMWFYSRKRYDFTRGILQGAFDFIAGL